MKLKGKIAVITGGSSGIGLAAAKRFVDEGAYVFITGRRAGDLAEAKSAIGRNVSTIQGDVSSLTDLDRLYEQVKAEKGVIDIVVASAGIGAYQLLAEATPDHFDQLFGINVRGLYFSIAKALPLMTRGGSIVLLSSGLHLKGVPTAGAYSAGKAAVRSFSRTWAAELKDRGIRVNTLSPGGIDTPIHDRAAASPSGGDAARSMLAHITPMGRLGQVDEMANAVLFLASDDSSFSTGIDLVADGGITQL